MKAILSILLVTQVLFASQITYSEEEKTYLKKKGTIKMCVDNDWEPFEKVENGVHVGIAGDLIRLVEKRGNLKIELVDTKDWKETLAFGKERKCDILSFLNDTPKRRSWLTFTDPLFSDPNILVGRIDSKAIEDLSKEDLTLVLPEGTSIEERVRKQFPHLKIITTKDEATAFKMIEDRKADVSLRSMIVTAYNIKKKGLFNLKIVGEVEGYENHLRIGVRNDEPILRDILNKSIATLSKKDRDNVVNNHVTIVIETAKNYTAVLWALAIFGGIIIVTSLWNYLLNKKVKAEVAKNIAQEKQLEEKARKAEIGDLTANISHQWKNGLTQISSLNLDMQLMNDLDENLDKEMLRARLKSSEKSIAFMNDTMNVFLNFYKGKDDTTTFSLKENIEQVLQLIDIRIKSLKTIVEIDEKSPLKIEGNQNEWLHVWLNFINNSIAANEVNHDEGTVLNIKITLDKDKITYEDNAGGFDEETLAKVKAEEYSGLGIKMTQNILKKHGYKMGIKNKENGVIFKIIDKDSAI